MFPVFELMLLILANYSFSSLSYSDVTLSFSLEASQADRSLHYLTPCRNPWPVFLRPFPRNVTLSLPLVVTCHYTTASTFRPPYKIMQDCEIISTRQIKRDVLSRKCAAEKITANNP